MIEVTCDHCKQKLLKPTTRNNKKNFEQILNDDMTRRADLCLNCYEEYKTCLNEICDRHTKMQEEAEKIFIKNFLKE